MTNPAAALSTLCTLSTDFFALLRRARAVRDAAKTWAARRIEISGRQCALIAAADPSDAESLADAVEEADHVCLIAAAHPGCEIRPDGSVAPEGAGWEACDGEGWWTLDPDEAPPTASVRRALRVAMADVKASAEAPQMGQKTMFWDVSVRLTVVNRYGFQEKLEDASEMSIDPEEPPCGEGEEHEWRSSGIWGHGAGTIEKDRCKKCGVFRTINTWDFRPDNGEPCETIRYDEADEDDEAD